MAYEQIMPLSSLSQMTPCKITVGKTDILVIRRGEEVYALEATCPHTPARRWKRGRCAKTNWSARGINRCSPSLKVARALCWNRLHCGH